MSDSSESLLGITKEGLQTALKVRDSYRSNAPISVPGEPDRLLLPEYLLNPGLDLTAFEDPLPLAMVATKDPESPMALAAATRLSPKAENSELVTGVFSLVGEASKHPLVKKCVDLVTDSAFAPEAIATVRRHTQQYIVETRREYSLALRQNLQALLDGLMQPREFVHEFFQLTEAGNLQSDIRQKLVTSLLLSDTIRPGIKFLMLENFERFPVPTRHGIISSVLQAPESAQREVIKEELRWIVAQERKDAETQKKAEADEA